MKWPYLSAALHLGSSPGRPTESVSRTKMCNCLLWPVLWETAAVPSDQVSKSGQCLWVAEGLVSRVLASWAFWHNFDFSWILTHLSGLVALVKAFGWMQLTIVRSKPLKYELYHYTLLISIGLCGLVAVCHGCLGRHGIRKVSRPDKASDLTPLDYPFMRRERALLKVKNVGIWLICVSGCQDYGHFTLSILLHKWHGSTSFLRNVHTRLWYFRYFRHLLHRVYFRRLDYRQHTNLNLVNLSAIQDQ